MRLWNSTPLAKAVRAEPFMWPLIVGLLIGWALGLAGGLTIHAAELAGKDDLLLRALQAIRYAKIQCAI